MLTNTPHPFAAAPRMTVSAQPLRLVLVGTHQTLDQLTHQIQLLDPQPVVIQRILCDPTSPLKPRSAPSSQSLQPTTLALTTAINTYSPIDLALVSLPLIMRTALEQVIQQLVSHNLPWRFIPALADQLAGRIKPPLSLGENTNPIASNTDPADQPSPGEFSEALSAAFSGGFSGGGLWNVDPVQILSRRPKPLDEHRIHQTLHGRSVLITGSGGSIGSELARTVCQFAPSKIILVERAENPLFEIDRQLASVFPHVPRAAILHDVTDAPGTLALVRTHRPDVILHAAAHKHVPMMEEHPAQAVENNFYGTRSIADAAAALGVQRFVMISTDKAVNPSSVMGATKRLAELYIQHLNTTSPCVFCMVRFGNVLGSACSVLPIWSRQLAAGGPITVTHPDMQRYFMTIPEAAGLVLQATALAQGGEVFLLDMGQPVRISDLARRFVQSHGLQPDADVQIQYTGIRPGEKLYEELAYHGEDMLPTPHQSIRTWKAHPADPARMQQIITAFDRLRAKGPGDRIWHNATKDSILAALRWAIPEMVHAAVG